MDALGPWWSKKDDASLDGPQTCRDHPPRSRYPDLSLRCIHSWRWSFSPPGFVTQADRRTSCFTCYCECLLWLAFLLTLAWPSRLAAAACALPSSQHCFFVGGFCLTARRFQWASLRGVSPDPLEPHSRRLPSSMLMDLQSPPSLNKVRPT